MNESNNLNYHIINVKSDVFETESNKKTKTRNFPSPTNWDRQFSLENMHTHIGVENN